MVKNEQPWAAVGELKNGDYITSTFNIVQLLILLNNIINIVIILFKYI